MKNDEFAFFNQQLAAMLRDGIPLEGALRRVIANSRFTGHAITIEFTKEALKDLLSLQAKLVTIENIQKTVADYYKLRMADLLSKRRSRSVARPRQVAMALANEDFGDIAEVVLALADEPRPPPPIDVNEIVAPPATPLYPAGCTGRR